MRTWAGFVYVSFVIDCFPARLPAGSHGAPQGLWRRDRVQRAAGGGLIQHSDAGSRFTSVSIAETLALEGIAASIGLIGDANDNALAGSTIGLFKTQAVCDDSSFRSGPLRQLEDVEWITVEWADCYNARRRQSTLGDVLPDQFKVAHCADLETPSHPVLAPA